MQRARSSSVRLRRGDTVGVVATGFAMPPDKLHAGAAAIGRMGYRVALGQHVLARDGYLAGSDDERAQDLLEMLERPDVDAIWFARGGYGTARLLDRLPWRKLARRTKPLLGYSDLTALFAPAVDRLHQVCLHGPGVTELGDPGAFHRPSLIALLAGRPVTARLRRAQVLVPGRARGRLVGGNLTVLTHLLGTPYAPDVRDAVLFLEEVGEETYRIDRLLGHLRLAGVLSRVAGVLLGAFAVPETRRSFPPDRSLDVVWRESFAYLGVPVVTGLRAGHVAGKWTLPLGGGAEIDTAAGTLRFVPRFVP